MGTEGNRKKFRLEESTLRPSYNALLLLVIHVLGKFRIEQLKVPGPIVSDFFKLSEILVSEETSYIFFSSPLVNFTAEKCTVGMILIKM